MQEVQGPADVTAASMRDSILVPRGPEASEGAVGTPQAEVPLGLQNFLVLP